MVLQKVYIFVSGQHNSGRVWSRLNSHPHTYHWQQIIDRIVLVGSVDTILTKLIFTWGPVSRCDHTSNYDSILSPRSFDNSGVHTLPPSLNKDGDSPANPVNLRLFRNPIPLMTFISDVWRLPTSTGSLALGSTLWQWVNCVWPNTPANAPESELVSYDPIA